MMKETYILSGLKPNYIVLEPPRSSDGSLSDGRYSEGDQIELTAKISNDALGVVDNIGDLLNTAMKTKLGKLAASAMSPYVGKTIEAGSTLASVLASAVSSFNIVTDKNGFEVIGTFEWTHFSASNSRN